MICLLQEAFVNILKHVKARNIQVLLYRDDDTLLLEMEDDGQGFYKRWLRMGIDLANMQVGVEAVQRNPYHKKYFIGYLMANFRFLLMNTVLSLLSNEIRKLYNSPLRRMTGGAIHLTSCQ